MAYRGTKTRLSCKKKFVADGVFYSELNEFLTSELAEDGYAGVEVRTTPYRTELIIRATRTQNVLGENNRRIRELTSAVQKRFNFADGAVELYAERVQDRGLCAQAQAESLKFKLLGGLAVRRACYGVVRFVMEATAKGCEVIVSGKLRGQRAKAMKFGDGYMIKTGHAGQVYTDVAVRHVLMRQGVIGIKVSIFLPQDPLGIKGPKIPLDDVVTIIEPKEEINPAAILAQQAAQAQQAAAYAALQAQQQAMVDPAAMDAVGIDGSGDVPGADEVAY
jgi:small subunit ribosomal protein S3e